MLGTQGWQKIVDEQVDVSDGAEGTQQSEGPLVAIDRLVDRFNLVVSLCVLVLMLRSCIMPFCEFVVCFLCLVSNLNISLCFVHKTLNRKKKNLLLF